MLADGEMEFVGNAVAPVEVDGSKDSVRLELREEEVLVEDKRAEESADAAELDEVVELVSA